MIKLDMKKVFWVTGFLLMMSCGKQENEASVEATQSAVTVPTSGENGAAQTALSTKDGDALIAQYDCVSCHSKDEKMVGPAYRDIAKKYTPAEAKLLAEKIIKGGSGVWGSIPMTPHPDISQDDAEKMAAYILSLR